MSEIGAWGGACWFVVPFLYVAILPLVSAFGRAIVLIIIVACGLSACGLVGGGRGQDGPALSGGDLGSRSGTVTVESDHRPPSRPIDDRVEWVDCAGSEWCGWLVVPLDYDYPDGETVRLRFSVRPADNGDPAAPYLFFNPGGPAESVVGFLAERPDAVASDAVRDRFHIVGLEPRGVGLSGPEFGCGHPGEQEQLLDRLNGATDPVLLNDQLDAASALCSTSMGPSAGAFHTGLVARDHEQLRQALGSPLFTYVGYSYGSFIGLLYASLFPENVRAMVFDAAYPPAGRSTLETPFEAAFAFPQSIEIVLVELLAACDRDCAIYNDGDPEAYFLRATRKAAILGPEFGSDSGRFGSAVLANLYDQALWPRLWDGLAALVENDDPSLLLEDAERVRGREATGGLRRHVNCLDSWLVDDSSGRDSGSGSGASDAGDPIAEVGDQQAAIEERFPLYSAIDFGATFDPCSRYDFAPEPLAGPLDGGGAPVLVIGNSADAITPLKGSAIVARETLLNGYLIEVDHPTHTVYPFNRCVTEMVDEVLLDAAYPTARTVRCDAG